MACGLEGKRGSALVLIRVWQQQSVQMPGCHSGLYGGCEQTNSAELRRACRDGARCERAEKRGLDTVAGRGRRERESLPCSLRDLKRCVTPSRSRHPSSVHPFRVRGGADSVLSCAFCMSLLNAALATRDPSGDDIPESTTTTTTLLDLTCSVDGAHD